MGPDMRIPPHDLNAERAVLGAMLLDNPQLDVVLGVLRPDDFYSDANRRIFEAMVALHGTRSPIDSVTLRAQLGSALQAVGGDEYLLGLTDTIPVVENTQAHAKIIAEKSLVRRIIEAADTLAAKGYSDHGDPLELTGWAASTIEAMSASGALQGKMGDSAREMAEAFLEELDRPASERTRDEISLGLPMLKSVVGPLFPGAVLVIGADTNVGKSSFVLEILLAAARDGSPAGYISMEDPKALYRARFIAALTDGLSTRNIQARQDRERIVRGAMAFSEFEEGIIASECIGFTEAHVMARMSYMAQRGVRLIAVDYIQEVHASTAQQDRRNEVRWVLGRLKGHAARLGVALIVVSQLSRPKDGNKHREPAKHDLKEAGDLENGAEFIVMLWRMADHDYEPLNLKLEKSKVGGVGKRWLMQREVFATDRDGRPSAGSSRLREVVENPQSPADYTFPLVVRDYLARLSLIQKAR